MKDKHDMYEVEVLIVQALHLGQITNGDSESPQRKFSNYSMGESNTIVSAYTLYRHLQ